MAEPSHVHATLAKHYPTRVLDWVKRATWKRDPAVPLAKIDMSRRPGGRDPQKVASIAQAVNDGKPMPPVVLVDTGDAKLQIADGYHRTLGFAHARKRTIPALIASGVGKHGPWEKRMHDAKLNLTADCGHPVDLAGVCTGPGPCDTKPFGAGDNWVNKAGGLPAYIRAVAHAFTRKGMPESQAIQRAVGVVRNWAEGKGGVTAQTRARAAAAIAEWEAKKAKAHSLTADPTASVDLAWNESLHPRNKGKFAPKGAATTTSTTGGGSLPPGVAANVRDFQRRMKLPVTGVIDVTTAAKIRALTTLGGKGKNGKRAKARALAAARRRVGQQVSRVNSLTAAQRGQLRQRMPVPPTGYVWTSSNNLRAVPLTAAQKIAPLTGI